ncbi:putative trna-specific adenosine deaminase-like protein [Diaporthe ampelina]|uniref:Putative trna-specific adenosine deaminase-like protein n=1 Tax=Diaporthe ampelina TaxID=1214573 RepID=A0A0G2FYJ1_9PEZI|nr:putative trna-specific adenosine deaminase-like protein [Diaporthe ampelina]
MQRQSTTVRPQHAYGPKAVNGNARPAVKPALPQIGPAVKASRPVKQDGASTNGAAATTALEDVTNGVNPHPKHHIVGDEEAEENLHDQVDLAPTVQPVEGEEEPEDPAKAAERAIHHGFMDQALDMARLALKTNETPVGCVLVHNKRVIAKGMNATNVTRNGTRHAELMALTALLSFTPEAEAEQEKPKKSKGKKKKRQGSQQHSEKPPPSRIYTDQEWGDVDPEDGHIYPYGQKFHPAPIVDRTLIQECILYVTVEPCVMCASMLRQYGIKKVYFGAVNDKFGGTGGVFCIHKNSDPAHAVSIPAPPIHRPVANQLPSRPPLAQHAASAAASISTNGSQEGPAATGENKQSGKVTYTEPPKPVSNMTMGHGGNVERGFDAEGGWNRDEAVNLLRQFYVQENGRAPVPRKKEGRAQRLAVMMEEQGMSTEGTALEGLLRQEREAQEKAAARAANGEIDGTESAQNGTDQQSDAPNALAALEAKVYAEIEKKKQASMARNVDGNKTNSADHPKATA